MANLDAEELDLLLSDYAEAVEEGYELDSLSKARLHACLKVHGTQLCILNGQSATLSAGPGGSITEMASKVFIPGRQEQPGKLF
jgi:hypothetical protein